ncbi:MAG: LVIVD repeat-containing protein [Anaerolineaceae bacterium]
MRVYQKFVAALVVIFSSLAFVPYADASFLGSGVWQQSADASRPRDSAENISFVSALNLQSDHVVIDDTYLYSTFNNVSAVDNSNPSSLKVVNKLRTNYIYDLELSGRYVFAAQEDFGVRVFDVSVGLPTVFGSRPMAESALGLDLVDGVLYIANGQSGLILIDATKPTDLPILSETDTAGMALDVAAGGHYAYLANGLAGLRIFDVTDKTRPVEIALMDTPGSAADVTLDGTTLYLADGEDGLRILDVSIPAEPRELSVYDTPGTVEKTFIQGDYAYIADRKKGLTILDIKDKSRPVKIGSYDSMGGAWDVVVKDGFIYLADFPYGVQVLKFVPPLANNVTP